MPVYLIRAGATEFVKIGWADDPEARRLTLQTAHWLPLSVIRLIDGVQATERWMHRRFRERHVLMEWYCFDEAMLTIDPPALMPMPDTPLGRYLNDKSMSVAEFAALLGVRVQAVYRYVNETRLPNRSVMLRIMEVTEGAVTADDFYHDDTAAA